MPRLYSCTLMILAMLLPRIAAAQSESPPIVDCMPGPYMVFFDHNSAGLDAEAEQVIGFVVSVDAGPCGGHVLTIIGHRDAGETRRIDRERAESVRDRLRALGIRAAALRVRRVGAREPRVIPPRGGAERQNQRVTIFVGPL